MIFNNYLQIDSLLQSGNIVFTEPTSIFSSPLPFPASYDGEVQSSNIVDILYNLLNEKFSVKRTAQPIYFKDISVPGCVGAKARIAADVPPACTPESYK